MLYRRLILGLPLAGLALLSTLGVGRAALQPDEVQAVLKAELYLNRITTLHARFVQVSSNGAYAEGEVHVQRPGRLRFEYDPPHPVLLIADGINLLYYDKELKQATFIPLWETPLWFLIRKQVDLSGNIQVTDVSLAAGTVRITVQEKGADQTAAVTLAFSDQPFALRSWEVTDAQGITTRVSLLNPVYGRKASDKLFEYGDLDVYGFRGSKKDR
jgi:outer membrane lipoprotein-sorting protein